MSGIEVLGLLLGAVPLFISAAENYRDGLQFIKRAIHRKQFVKQYKDELEIQRTLLCLYIKAVVGKTDLSPDLQAELVDRPEGNAWRKAAVVKALRNELRDAYEPFVTLLVMICTTLAKQIVSDDPSDGSPDGELVSAPASMEFMCTDLTHRKISKLEELCLDAAQKDVLAQADIWKRIKFSWKQPDRLRMLAELKSYNASLERLGVAANHAKPYERKQQVRRAHTTFELRDDAEKLYEAICKACNCRPLQQRDIGLGLAVHHQSISTEALSFQLLLFGSDDKVFALSVKMMKASGDAEPQRKKVRITLPKPRGAATPCDQMKRLQDICKECRIAQQSKAHLQLIVDDKGELYTSSDAEPKTKLPNDDPVISLCEVMSKFKLYDRKRWMQREKAILAVVLSYSLLQLYESSWCQTLWNSEGISFLGFGSSGSATRSSPDQRIRLRKPFTRSVVMEGNSQGAPDGVTRKNAHLHALGIILLEIYLNRTIKNDENSQVGTDCRAAAQDLLEEHADDMDMTSEYLCAIRFCLCPRPSPHSGSFSFEDSGFREIFYSEVISMLEDNLMSRFEVNDTIWQDGGD